MQKRKNKLLIFALAFALLLNAFAGLSFGDKGSIVYAASETRVVSDNAGDYATFTEAYNAAQDGDTIKLEKDAAAGKTGSYGFDIVKNITLDLNDHILHYTGDMYGLFVNSGANVVIKNGTVTSISPSTIYITGSTNVTLENVTLENTNTGTNHFSLYAASSAKSLIIKGSTNLVYSDGIPTTGAFYINGSVSASIEAGIYNFDPTTYVDTSKFWVDSTSTPDSYVVKTIITISANTGLFENDTEQIGVPEGEGYTLSGDFKATTAGNYTATVSLKEGYVWADTHTTESRNINWTISASATIAKIGDTEFKTLAGALKSAQAGTTEAEKTITVIGAATGVTFDGNYNGIIIEGAEGNKITGNFTSAENASLKGVKILGLKFEDYGINFSARGINLEGMTIEDCEFDGNGTTANKQRALIINANNAKDLTINHNTIKNYETLESTAILIGTVDNFTDFAEDYEVTISNNTIENIAYNAIQAVGLKNLNITYNIITNAKKNKGPINVSDSENVIIAGNTITLAENYAGAFYNINKGIVVVANNTIKDSAGTELTFDETLANVDNEYTGVTDTGVITLIDGGKIRYIAISENIIEDAIEGINVELVPDTDYTYVAIVASIDDANYETLADAIDAAVNNNTIVLLANNEEEIVVSKEITFSIDADEFTNNAAISAGTGYVLKSSVTDKVTTYTVKKIEEPNPDTSDKFILYITIGGSSLIGLVGSILYLKRRKAN